MAFAREMMFLSIENSWQVGFGPNGKPYWMCCEEALDFFAPVLDAPF